MNNIESNNMTIGLSKDIKVCYHCGLKTKHPIVLQGHDFCCYGCKNVFEILNQNNLCKYYDLNSTPGNNANEENLNKSKFNFLEDELLLKNLLIYDSENLRKLNFYLPQIHCSSCLYLLENLHKINPGVSSAKLNFTKKELTVTYFKGQISAKQIASLLSQLGYEPYFSLNDVKSSQNKSRPYVNQRLYRLGIAGFSFSNIMLMSFPEYFDWGNDVSGLSDYFQWFSLLLSLPVFFYSASEFYRIAWGGVMKKHLTIDLPIAVALLITFGRSIYEITTHSGPGYFDSLTGIVFFMLLGRYLQDRTYENLSFSRDYSSYFPLNAHVWKRGKELEFAIHEVQKDDELMVHNQEIIVADGILVKGIGIIDYSFVTGENNPVEVKEGDWVYAGGRQLGSSIRIVAQKSVSQGYLVSLWNQSTKANKENSSELGIQTDENRYVHIASQWFTVVLFTIAVFASMYWYWTDPSKVWHVLTSVLIVACPCALLLSVTFTNGHILSVLARNGLYVRNARSLENWRKANVVVFDKTGTLTDTHHPDIQYSGKNLTEDEWDAVATVAKESIHPIARSISKFLDRIQVPLEDVKNHVGEGVEASYQGELIQLGSPSFVGLSSLYTVDRFGDVLKNDTTPGSEIWLSINHSIHGVFRVKSQYRQNLKSMLEALRKKKSLTILSGDNASESQQIETLIPNRTLVRFNVKPHEKVDFIAQIQLMGKKVVMVGDGLNDAGALQQADFSIAVTENVGYFTPGSDAILVGSSLSKLHELWALSNRAKRIVWWSFAISILYNILGLSYAVSGSLNPLIAAILMPASSISIVLFTFVAANWGHWNKTDKNHTSP